MTATSPSRSPSPCFSQGELRALRVIAEDLQTWEVITEDDLEVIHSIIRNALERMDNEVEI